MDANRQMRGTPHHDAAEFGKATSRLFPEGVQSMSVKFFRKEQQFTRVFGSNGPANQRPILIEFCNFSKPLRSALV